MKKVSLTNIHYLTTYIMLKKILTILLIAFIIAQFFNPQKNEYTSIPESDFILIEKPPQQISAILKESCYDCHSSNTRYPWYDRITPVNFWVNGHIEHGKGKLNFSEWKHYSAKKKAHKLDEVIEALKNNEMPLSSYTFMHSGAKLTEDKSETLINWATITKIKYEITDLPQ